MQNLNTAESVCGDDTLIVVSHTPGIHMFTGDSWYCPEVVIGVMITSFGVPCWCDGMNGVAVIVAPSIALPSTPLAIASISRIHVLSSRAGGAGIAEIIL